MQDLIGRQDALKTAELGCEVDAINELPFTQPERIRGLWIEHKDYPGSAYLCSESNYFTTFKMLPSAEPEISRIEQELHGKTPEEQYEFLDWLMFNFALAYTDSRLAVIEWLRGEEE